MGKGAFGSVFKVKQKLDESLYAVKKVRPGPRIRDTPPSLIRNTPPFSHKKKTLRRTLQ